MVAMENLNIIRAATFGYMDPIMIDHDWPVIGFKLSKHFQETNLFG